MIDIVLKKLETWSSHQPRIKALAIVGSHARGTARADSDIDIILICSEPNEYLQSTDWLSTFGDVKNIQRENWGLVQSWRVFYADGTEIEFGITPEKWCCSEEIDPGTRRVIGDGAKIAFDPDFLLADLIAAVGKAEDLRS